MKKLILLLCFGIISSIAGNPSIEKALFVPSATVYRPFDALYRASYMVESSGNDSALNRKEMAYGRMQIRAIRIKDYNKRTGKSYSLQDCYKEEISKEIWYYYATKFHPSDYIGIAKSWNGRGKSNRIYWQKIKKQLEKQK